MTKLLGIDFAPLNIPFVRRIQTLCTLQWVLTFLFGGFGSLFLAVYLLFTRFYWVPIVYILWYFYDRNTAVTGGHYIRRIRESIVWKRMGEYFPANLHKTAELDPTKSYIFGLHPHGIMQTNGFLSFATESTGFSQKFPGLIPHLVILAGQFQFPFYRDYLLTSGKYFSYVSFLCPTVKSGFRFALVHLSVCPSICPNFFNFATKIGGIHVLWTHFYSTT